jgi:hypothetical protein
MNPLHFLVEAFVNTFGITRPSQHEEAAAGRYIAGMLLAVLLLLLGGAAWLVRHAFAR